MRISIYKILVPSAVSLKKEEEERKPPFYTCRIDQTINLYHQLIFTWQAMVDKTATGIPERWARGHHLVSPDGHSSSGRIPFPCENIPFDWEVGSQRLT